VFARITTYEGRLERVDEFLRAMVERVLPALRRLPGYQGGVLPRRPRKRQGAGGRPVGDGGIDACQRGVGVLVPHLRGRSCQREDSGRGKVRGHLIGTQGSAVLAGPHSLMTMAAATTTKRGCHCGNHEPLFRRQERRCYYKRPKSLFSRSTTSRRGQPEPACYRPDLAVRRGDICRSATDLCHCASVCRFLASSRRVRFHSGSAPGFV